MVVGTEELVPGDVVELCAGDVVPADMVLLGGSVIVNESMLTGEAVPVVKSAIPSGGERARGDTQEGQGDKGPGMFCPTECRGSVLLCGTRVVSVSPGETPALRSCAPHVPNDTSPPAGAAESSGAGTGGAMVIRTGLLTAKGSLVRSILFPKVASNDFFKDSVCPPALPPLGHPCACNPIATRGKMLLRRHGHADMALCIDTLRRHGHLSSCCNCCADMAIFSSRQPHPCLHAQGHVCIDTLRHLYMVNKLDMGTHTHTWWGH